MNKNSRNYGIDVLRIMLAFMVLTIHCYAGGTGQVLKYATETPWRWIANGICLLCYPAVNCYVLISAFFAYKRSKGITQTVEGLIKLWFAVLFYSVLGYVGVSILTGNFSLLDLVKRFFPISRGTWWFFTVYFVITLCSPYLIRLADSISHREYIILMGILLMSCSVIPAFVNWEGQLGTNYGYSLLWFAVLFLSGIYFSKYKYIENRKSLKVFFTCIVAYVGLSIFSYFVTAVFRKIGIAFPMSHYNCINVYAQAVILVWGFMHLPVKVKYAKVIGKISALSLAAYLLHCQEDIDAVLWSSLKLWNYANSVYIIPILIATVSAVFLCSIVIERIRLICVGKIGVEEKITKRLIELSKKLLAKVEKTEIIGNE